MGPSRQCHLLLLPRIRPFNDMHAPTGVILSARGILPHQMLRDGGERIDDSMRGRQRWWKPEYRCFLGHGALCTAGSAGSMWMTTGDKDQHLEGRCQDSPTSTGRSKRAFCLTIRRPTANFKGQCRGNLADCCLWSRGAPAGTMLDRGTCSPELHIIDPVSSTTLTADTTMVPEKGKTRRSALLGWDDAGCSTCQSGDDQNRGCALSRKTPTWMSSRRLAG
jgi:hypothetical protein